MNNEDVREFLKWWEEQKLPDSNEREKHLASMAWEAAIKYEKNKPVRTYRWDGVLP